MLDITKINDSHYEIEVRSMCGVFTKVFQASETDDGWMLRSGTIKFPCLTLEECKEWAVTIGY